MIRSGAIRLLGSIGVEATMALEPLRELRDDAATDPTLRQAAEAAIEAIKKPSE